MRQVRGFSVLVAGAAYVLIGTATAMLAQRASTAAVVKEWRAAAWLLSLAVFAMHFAFERRRDPRRARVATKVALGVALGAFGLAALGPVRAHWADPSRSKIVMLSLLAWPILLGVPAFLATLVGSLLLDRAAFSLSRRWTRT
jgi:xanthine/uracil permease